MLLPFWRRDTKGGIILPSKQHALRFGFAYLALVVAVQAVQFGAAAVIGRFWPGLTEADGYVWLMSVLPLYGVGLPICLAFLPAREDVPAVRSMKAGHWLLALVVALGLMFAGNLIGNGLMLLVGLLRGEPVVNRLNEIVLDADPRWTAVVTVVIAPLGEELLFRRLIIDRVRQYGERTAVVLSALMFGAFHLNFYQFFYAALIGLVFGYIYVKTERLRYTVALHAAINLLGGLLAPALLRGLMPLLDAPELTVLRSLVPVLLGYLLYAALLAGCALVTLVLGIVCWRRIALEVGTDAPLLWHSPTVVMFFAVCAVLSVAVMLR